MGHRRAKAVSETISDMVEEAQSLIDEGADNGQPSKWVKDQRAALRAMARANDAGDLRCYIDGQLAIESRADYIDGSWKDDGAHETAERFEMERTWLTSSGRP
jgi:hypothetical protein